MLLSHPIIFFTTAFGAVSMANPIANAEAAALAIPDDLPEWESYSTSLEARNADPAGLEARQGGPIACIATVGLGPPSQPSFRGCIGVRPGLITGFFVRTAEFPNCEIGVEVNYPNCAQYRVVSIQNCGGERLVDISDGSSCPPPPGR
ncbi:hypothetical protein CUC08_Gglean012754 [Alternaria sp. MG1]|nr:hypothetical protein AALT_g1418 [Alternaria alternata]RII23923.1 hypothetical protein CUC08_Gglean012754 [Alternaria sp. MG1]